MIQSFLITLREGLEAALIVSIILAYLARTRNQGRFGSVWLGVGGAILFSLAVGAIIFALVGELSGKAEEIFEGLAMFTAVAVLSYMVIWMKRQAVNIRTHLEAQVQSALAKSSALALTLLSFVVVGREGLETALFMFSAVRTSTPLQSTAGGLLGLAISVALGYMLYRGSYRLNLRLFFNVTGVLLIFFAAGLLARGIHEFQEAGLLPTVVEHVWDINNVLHEKAGVGAFLKGLFGYNGNPSLVEVVVYPLYMLAALTYFLRQPRQIPVPTAQAG